MLRLLDLMPLFLLKFNLFRNMAFTDRVALFERLEQSRFGPLRLMMVAIKLYVVMPFFNVPEPEEGLQFQENV